MNLHQSRFEHTKRRPPYVNSGNTTYKITVNMVYSQLELGLEVTTRSWISFFRSSNYKPVRLYVQLNVLRANPCKHRPKSPIRDKAQNIKNALLLYTGRPKQVYKRYVVFFRKMRSLPRKTWKTVSSPAVDFANRVEIHYDSHDSPQNNRARKHIAKILSTTRRWPKYITFLELQQSE